MDKSVEKCLTELVDRFDLVDTSLVDTIENSKAAITSTPEADRAAISVSIVYDFVTSNVYGVETP